MAVKTLVGIYLLFHMDLNTCSWYEKSAKQQHSLWEDGGPGVKFCYDPGVMYTR